MDLVLFIAQSLVDHPNKVLARWVDGPQGGHVELKVSPEDRGKIIGKQGRTIRSLRQLVTAAFAENEEQVGVELSE